ncbi:chemoreceptor glutamine deamidase CheD [Alteromonadaceae bacterium M269]|nr:chemoreceptor glutamine deamidase CheD [Alteromonadaceae bacterium M269]
MLLANRKKDFPPCLRGFEHVNRYLDRQNKKIVAKILPGEFYVSRSEELIATTLGSCVSACIWDEYSSIGGMNHFMLPLTDKESHEVTWGNDQSDATRFGNYAMEHLINEILANGGLRKNLRAKVFGGGKIMENMSDVGHKNCQFVIDYLATENVPIIAHDLGSTYPRKIMFDPISGKAHMKRLQSMHNNTLVDREASYQKSIANKPVEGDIELFD